MKQSELYEEVRRLETEVSEYMPHNDMIDRDEVLGLIAKVDESSEAYVIPEFLTNWLHTRKHDFKTPHEAMIYIHNYDWDDEMYIDEYKLRGWIPNNVGAFFKAWNECKEVVKIGNLYFSSGGEDEDGDFVVYATKQKEKAHIFQNNSEAKQLAEESGGKLELWEEG